MKFFKSSEWKLFYPIYVGLGVGITIPDIDMIMMLFFFAKGFTATQIGIGLGLQSLFLLLAEIPTGAFADMFGKRKSVQISWLMISLIFALFFFITEPWMMWLLFSLRGIAYTFSTGAFDALPYEIAKREKKEELINKFYSTYEFIYQFATALSNLNVIIFLYLVGATSIYYFLGQKHQGMDFLWLTGSIGYFVGAMILSRLKEKVKRTETDLKKNAKVTLALAANAIKYTKSHPVVSKLVLMGIFSQISLLLFADIVYQPFLLNLGVKTESIAVAVAVASLVAALFSKIPNLVSKKFSSEKKYMEFVLLMKIFVLLGLFIFSGPVYSMIFFLMYFGFDSLLTPLLTPFKQFFYHKDMRATLGSVESVIKNLISVVFFPLIGLSLDKFGVRKTILFALLPLMIEFLVFWSIRREKTQGDISQAS